MDNDRTRKLRALEFLCDNRYGVVSTISIQNKPESALVYYVVDGKDIFFITPSISRKLMNITTNERIAFVVFKELPPMEIQVEGIAQVVEDPQIKNRISGLYLEKANNNPQTINWPPILKLPNLDGFAFIKITVDCFKFSDFSKADAAIVEGAIEDWE